MVTEMWDYKNSRIRIVGQNIYLAGRNRYIDKAVDDSLGQR